MSVREELIEAIHQALRAPSTSEEDGCVAVLDGLLHKLLILAEDVAREAGDTFIDWQKEAPIYQWQRIIETLVAVLRNPGSSGGE